jgi:hypothetical protein
VGKCDPQKLKKFLEISCFEVLDVSFLWAESFFRSLDVLYGGLGISKLQIKSSQRVYFLPEE